MQFVDTYGIFIVLTYTFRNVIYNLLVTFVWHTTEILQNLTNKNHSLALKHVVPYFPHSERDSLETFSKDNTRYTNYWSKKLNQSLLQYI